MNMQTISPPCCSSMSPLNSSSISTPACSSISPQNGSPVSQSSNFSTSPRNYTSISQIENSSISPLNCSSISQTDNSSISPINCFPISQTEYSSISPLNFSNSQSPCSSISPQNCSFMSQPECASISSLNYPSISQTDYSFSSSQKYSFISQTDYFSSSPQNSISQTHYASISPLNCTSISQPNCDKSPLTSSSIGQPNYCSVPTTKYPTDGSSTPPFQSSTLSLTDCSSIPQPNYSTECQLNQYTTPAQKCSTTSPSDSCSLSPPDHSSISPLNIPSFQACDLTTDCLPDISISHKDSHLQCSSLIQNNTISSSTVEYSSLLPSEFNNVPPGDFCYGSHICPTGNSCTCQAQNNSHFTPSGFSPDCFSLFASPKPPSGRASLDLPNNITPTNSDITYTQTMATGFSSSHTVTPGSAQDLPSKADVECDIVSYSTNTSDAPFNDHSYISKHSSHLSTKLCTCPSFCNCSLTRSTHHSPISKVLGSCSDSPPAPHSTCLTSPDHTAFTHIASNTSEILPCCPYAYCSGLLYISPPEEQKETKKCEICKASVENKVRMEQDRQLCELFLNSLSRFEDWLQIAKITASLRNPFQTLHKEAKLALRKYEVLLREMQEKLLDLESLNRQYWRLTQTRHQALLPSVLRSRMQEVNMFWYHLQRETETVHQTLKSRVQQREEFDTDQEDMKLCLTEMDLELSSVEYIYGGNSTEKIQQLKAFQEDVWSNIKRVECLLERGGLLIDNSDPQDAETLEEEMTELGSYCQEIFIRLSRLQKRLVSTKLVFEDNFLDSGFEHASSGSSDVFLDLDIEQDEVPSPLNIPAANVVLAVDLEWDPLGDVGRSSSHDGQESFYTATSAPWKIFQRSEGSQSSFSSDFGASSSKLRTQEDQEPLIDVVTSHTAPWDTCSLKGTQEQMDSPGQIEDTATLHSSLPGMETDSCSVSISTEELNSALRMDNPLPAPGHCWNNPDQVAPVTFDALVTDSKSHHIGPGHRRRQGKKKRAVLTQDVKRKLQPAKQEVSILMENRDDLSNRRPHKTSYSSPGFLRIGIKRLASFLVLLLVFGSSLLIFSRPSCSSHRFSWSLRLTYVNGPPPT
ncbi:uncharacterized protein LOC142102168 [Mixophyes fleayi]|uniref:uncharacterized protein LOC142102168 n=1 Tax=Mixophyes fleayi TaxID=3061075 RepID=UPI003F4E00A0